MSLFNDNYDAPKARDDNKAKVKWASLKSKDLKPGTTENQYRIAPPLGKGNNAWYVKSSVHWGYKTSPRDKPDVKYAQRFLCIRKKNFNTKAIEVECPECLSIEEIKTRRDSFVELKSENSKVTKEAAQAEWEKANPQDAQYLNDHRLDNKFNVYALNRNNEWCVLKLNSWALGALKTKIQYLKTRKKSPVDPIKSTTGVWFDFIPAQTAQKGQWTIEVCDDDAHQLTEHDEQILTAMPKLNSPEEFGIRSLTESEIVELVESKGAVADIVFERAWKKANPKKETTTTPEGDAFTGAPSAEDLAEELGL